MSNQFTVVKATPELFNEFQSLYHFSADLDTPNFNQGIFSSSLYSYIFLVNNKPIAAFGMYVLWKGVGECWLLSTPDLAKYPKSVIKYLRELTDEVLLRGLSRVQIYVNDTPMLHKWAQILGFTLEGVLHNHSIDGKNNAIYAKWA